MKLKEFKTKSVFSASGPWSVCMHIPGNLTLGMAAISRSPFILRAGIQPQFSDAVVSNCDNVMCFNSFIIGQRHIITDYRGMLAF